jgi:hypothetical protein
MKRLRGKTFLIIFQLSLEEFKSDVMTMREIWKLSFDYARHSSSFGGERCNKAHHRCSVSCRHEDLVPLIPHEWIEFLPRPATRSIGERAQNFCFNHGNDVN